jgi:hypothetical protein
MTLVIISAIILPLIFAKSAYAVCPVCTIAVGAGLGLSRWLGIDDTLSGIWVGGFVVSASLWFAVWLEKKEVRLPHKKKFSVLALYLLVLPTLYFTNMIGLPLNTIWGIDKLLLGILVGSAAFITSVKIDNYLRSRNEGKVYIAYQKVILPVSLLLISTFVFYFITS